MKAARVNPKEYLKTLEARGAPLRVTKPYQWTGLEIAAILRDLKHRSLYIKLAKEHDPAQLLRLAKQIAERQTVQNKGAYFMTMLGDIRRGNGRAEQHPRP